MSNELIETIISSDNNVRNRPINTLLSGKSSDELLMSAKELEDFRKSSANLYHKVRASLFLFVIYRFNLAESPDFEQQGTIPFEGVRAVFDRDFETSLDIYLSSGSKNSTVFSAIADSYHKLSFKYLLDQVKLSISHCNENYYLYNLNGLDDYPFSIPPELTVPDESTGLYPVGMDASPVRLDPSHSGWSDIFFLGMDFPEGARVVNMSVNLGVNGTGSALTPPCECYSRYIEEPVIHLVSIDLKSSKKISSINELFNFGNDYLSLLKAGVVASGIVPPCFESRGIELRDILHKLLGKPGGIEVVTRVNGIPKGSRLAVSTTLLATIISRLMRFSGQIIKLTGGLDDRERRIIASRAILGEWLGGSGGGWQDSGGLWPDIKVITGVLANEGAPEFGISRGCLLPEHRVFSNNEITENVEKNIIDSMVLVHGGISQDVGPILEMVTEKYLLKHDKEWNARILGTELFDKIVDALKTGDMRTLGMLTSKDWEEAIQSIIPWVNNAFTENLINILKSEFGEDYWGFLMLGGMSGGGMAFVVSPAVKDVFKKRVREVMLQLKDLYCYSYPFIIDPIVYDFDLNHDGIVAELLTGKDAKIPGISHGLLDTAENSNKELSEEEIESTYGFDALSHEHIKTLLKKGDIGLAQNRIPSTVLIEDVSYDDIQHLEDDNLNISLSETGMNSLRNNEAAVVTYAGGLGSRWTQGAAVVKSISPFIRMENRYRAFIEVHLAKSAKTGKLSGCNIPHVFTTSYLTHDAIFNYLANFDYFGCSDRIYLSPSGTIGKRVYPMERDLRFYWEEQLQQRMDDNVQKVQDDARRALLEWSKSKGEGEDYIDNRPILRFNPPGHWYEIPNLIKNGTLADMIRKNPGLKYLLCHNIDTLGANIEPGLLGLHINGRSCLTFEVTPRRIEDKGGGLAIVDGHMQLIEGLALSCEEDEYRLSYYNSLTNWITIDALLEYFGLNRDVILNANDDPERKKKVIYAIHNVEKMIPTYVTIKNVKYVWGNGQEDVYPVAQFEKLWGDMTSLKDLNVRYVSVPRYRGQQLKEPSMLDIWANDGSFDFVKKACIF
jgi:UDP-N-acetylglucosamine pyrophosphorylase